MKSLVIHEKSKKSYSAYVPDLPGCIATGPTKARVAQNIKEAIQFHLEGLKQEGMEIPQPQSESKLMEAM